MMVRWACSSLRMSATACEGGQISRPQSKSRAEEVLLMGPS